jgi:hypothetical protein
LLLCDPETLLVPESIIQEFKRVEQTDIFWGPIIKGTPGYDLPTTSHPDFQSYRLRATTNRICR